MDQLTPLKTMNDNTLFGEGDVFVLFGELFGRGYANSLVDEARKAGMTIVGITVGRRDENGQLRALTDEELATAEANLGGKIVNIPLMAGFDLDAPEGEPTPTDLLNKLTIHNWQDAQLDWDQIRRCHTQGHKRFTEALDRAMQDIDALIPSGKSAFFAHTMAGGIPKAKVFLALANRIYKGLASNQRHMSSDAFINSDMGELILKNFDEVSALTFQHLIDASKGIRERLEANGGQVRYTAYGYHGTEVLIDGEYRWQTYTNYTQGYAKMKLEDIARVAWSSGVTATVFNCPEIRTNSSDIFAGLELSLIPLLRALQREGGGEWADALWNECESLLQDGTSVDDMLQRVSDYQGHEAMQRYYDFSAWPEANSPEQAEQTIGTSAEVLKMHANPKVQVSDVLSRHVVDATGKLIFGEASKPAGPVLWLNHDIVARRLLADA
jgi:hypothetical protein